MRIGRDVRHVGDSVSLDDIRPEASQQGNPFGARSQIDRYASSDLRRSRPGLSRHPERAVGKAAVFVFGDIPDRATCSCFRRRCPETDAECPTLKTGYTLIHGEAKGSNKLDGCFTLLIHVAAELQRDSSESLDPFPGMLSGLQRLAHSLTAPRYVAWA